MKFFILSVLALSSFQSTQAYLGKYDQNIDCKWTYGGCKDDTGEYVIDLRTPFRKMADKARTCSLERGGCTEEDNKLNDLIRGKRNNIYNKDSFSKLFDKKRKDRAEYFIPLGLSDKEMIAALATASLGLVVFTQDQEIMDLVQEHKTDTTKRIEDFGYTAGREGILAIAAGSYFLGATMKNGKLKDIGIITVTAGLATQLVTEVFKLSFGRRRPKNAEHPYEFRKGEKSFFSGHASAAFSAATVISEVYKDDWAGVPYVAYGVAGLVAYARMHAKGHYATDVLYGALAGVLVTKLVYRIHKGDSRYGGFIVAPGIDPETGTFVAHFRWVSHPPKESFSCKEYEELDNRSKMQLCMDKLFREKYDGRSRTQKFFDFIDPL